MKKILLILSLLFCGTLYSSNEIKSYYQSGDTLYSVVRNSTGQVWDINDSVFEDWNDVNDYDFQLTDKNGGMYLGSLDSNIPDGFYTIITFKQTGIEPNDSNDTFLGYREGYWSGSKWSDNLTKEMIREEIDANSTQLAAIVADTNEIQTDWTNGGRLDTILDAIKTYTDLIVILSTDINDPCSTTSFTVTDGNSTANIYNGYLIMVQDADNSMWEVRIIEDWETDLTITPNTAFTFTPDTNDKVYIMGWGYLGNVWDKVQRMGQTMNIINTIDTTKIDTTK